MMIPVIKGLLIAMFLMALGVPGFSTEWWVAVVSMNVIVNL